MRVVNAMTDMNIKSFILWSVLGIAIGGGFYGAYIKFFGKNAIIQVDAYGSIGECASLIGSHDVVKIKAFIKYYESEKEKLQKSDASVAIVNIAVTQEVPRKPVGMGGALGECVIQLKNRVTELER